MNQQNSRVLIGNDMGVHERIWIPGTPAEVVKTLKAAGVEFVTKRPKVDHSEAIAAAKKLREEKKAARIAERAEKKEKADEAKAKAKQAKLDAKAKAKAKKEAAAAKKAEKVAA